MPTQRLIRRRCQFLAHRGQQFDITDQQQNRADSKQANVSNQNSRGKYAKPQKNQSRCFHHFLQIQVDLVIVGDPTRYLEIGANPDQ